MGISIHALREEGDALQKVGYDIGIVFLSTPSARRATSVYTTPFNISGISIHALREEGDNLENVRPRSLKDFYPRPPRGGRRHGHRGLFCYN